MFPLSLFFSLCSPLFLPPHLSTFSSIVLFNFLLCCLFACSQGLSTPHLTKPSSVFLLMELRQWWNQPPRKMQKGWGESSLSSNKKQIIPCLDLKKTVRVREGAKAGFKNEWQHQRAEKTLKQRSIPSPPDPLFGSHVQHVWFLLLLISSLS